MRKTKIVCTIGPASDSEETLRALADAGMNVARLNFSHGDYKEHGVRIKRIKRMNRYLAHPIAILLDTRGPEIRTGTFEKDINFGEIATKIVVDTLKKLEEAERLPMDKKVPYIIGIDRASTSELKSFCASIATYAGVALFHMENITPECVQAPKESISISKDDLLKIAARLVNITFSFVSSVDFTNRFCLLGCPSRSKWFVKILCDSA